MCAIEARSEAHIVCLGERRYRVDRDWLRWPTPGDRGFVSHVAVNSRDELHVLNRGNPVIQIFSPSGRFLGDWHTNLVTHGHGIHIDARDRIFIVDSDRHCVHVFSPTGQHQLSLGRRDRPVYGRPFNHPTDVTVTRNGHIYVSDGYGNSHVHRFAADGRHVATWGGAGAAPGAFANPHAIATAWDDTLLVVDRENGRVQRFTGEGVYVDEIRDLYLPTAVTVGEDGWIYVSDQCPRLSAYARDGRLIGRCRTFGAVGHGITIDSTGDVYIADMMPSGVSRFRRMS
ncbi:Serine/threonine-protein kinase PknD [Pandoraea terrae]|uniref:Serine/threonine-protein kinase PknD n=1 Tax=Pandoraea terrae TaxID=1537710 RepID=A0A5E4YAR9_9BURK|nr:hypothetical protein [Pandoraea terrae]VVE45796.1 Serine/threonine-protein kinase PknD [Pandoraea terrae]